MNRTGIEADKESLELREVVNEHIPRILQSEEAHSYVDLMRGVMQRAAQYKEDLLDTLHEFITTVGLRVQQQSPGVQETAVKELPGAREALAETLANILDAPDEPLKPRLRADRGHDPKLANDMIQRSDRSRSEAVTLTHRIEGFWTHTLSKSLNEPQR